MLAICYYPLMNVNELPRGCFIEVFEYFALQDQLGLRLVCKKWRSVILEMCRNRSSLKLFGGETNLMNYCRTLVQYGLFDNEHYIKDFRLYPMGKDDEIIGGADSPKVKCHFLPKLFPNLTNLTIDYNDLSKIDVSFLLKNWPKLSFFTLCHRKFMPKKVLFAINAHKSIKALHLICHESNYKNVCFPDIQLSILSQVEQFIFGGYECNVVQVFRPLGYNLRRLIIGDVQITIGQWKQLFNNKTQLRKTLTHISLFDTEAENTQKEMFKLVCTNLSSLTFLDLIGFDEMSFDYMLTQLARLQKLRELRMYLSSDFHNISNSLNKINQLPCLESVKKLELKPDEDFCLEDFYPMFPNSIPNLESLILHTEDVEMAQEVAKQAPSKFKRIRSFSQIYPDSTNRPLDFIGRHRLPYKKYMQKLIEERQRILREEQDMERCTIC